MDCYRSVFLSDLHLGSPWCRARNLLNFLENVTFEKLYLAGDVLDNWHLRRGHRLSRNQLLVWERLLEISRTRDVYYLVGNHDAFLFVDLPKAPRAKLRRYMGDEAAKDYLARMAA